MRRLQYISCISTLVLVFVLPWCYAAGLKRELSLEEQLIRSGRTLHVQCDLAHYFRGRRPWDDPKKAYKEFPVIPREIRHAVRWESLIFHPVCEALLNTQPFKGSIPEDSPLEGICTYYPTWDATTAAFDNNTAALVNLFFVGCSPMNYRHNSIYYRFKKPISSTSITDEVDIGIWNQPNLDTHEDVVFVNSAHGDVTLSCEVVMGLPDPTDALDDIIEKTIKAYNSSSAITQPTELDIGALSIKIKEGRDYVSTCPHANYRIQAEVGAYSGESLVARGFWVSRLVIDDQAPVIHNVPTQPGDVPLVVECASDAVRRGMREVPDMFRSRVYATDACRPAEDQSVPVQYAFHWMASDANACVNKGTASLEWTATDGCGNSASRRLNVYVEDTVSPRLTHPGELDICYVVQGLASTRSHQQQQQHSQQQVCLVDVLRSTLDRGAFSDNCDSPAELTGKVHWDDVSISQCEISGSIGTGRDKIQKCAPIAFTGTPPSQKDRPCYKGLREWTRLSVPFGVQDKCGNQTPQNGPNLEIYIVSRPQLCSDYGFTHVVFHPK